MALKVHNIFEAKQRKYGTTGMSFTEDFIDAVNFVTNDINSRLGLSTAAISSTNDSIDIDDLKYRALYSQGIDYFIAITPHWQVDDVSELFARYDRALVERWQRYLIEQAVVTKIGDVS